MINRVLSFVAVCIVGVSITGCGLVVKPYEEPVFVEIGTSDTAFAIPMNSQTDAQKSFQSEEYLNNHMVATKRIRVSREWVQTGRKWLVGIGPYVGYYQPQVRVIKVDRAPITVQWSTKNQNGIWVESRDSVGFSTGISLTARIKDDDDAIKFLFNYPPSNSTDVNEAEVSVSSLSQVLNDEVRARVQKVFSDQSAAEDMDELRAKKREIIKAIEQDIVPFFETRGITITTVAQFGGFDYENKNIQHAIDKVFEAQQDKQVAIAEFEAAEERKRALKSLGEGEASKSVEVAKGQAEAVQLAADAKAYEISKLLENKEFYIQLRRIEIALQNSKSWNGTLPHFLMGGNEVQVPNLLIQVPEE